MSSAHVDTFAAEHLPPRELQPEFVFDSPDLQFPAKLNCASELLDRWVRAGQGERPCILAEGVHWTYADLLSRANRIAHVLVSELGLVPGQRVLLRAPNTPMLAACWFAVMKAGGIAVATMPMLRARELRVILDKAQVSHALCDARLVDDLRAAQAQSLQHLVCFNDTSADGLEARMARQPEAFDNVATAADDTCLIAFTSGTTGTPKGTMHFHRDVMAACRCWPKHVLRPNADDVFIGSPPLAFTFGLGGLLLFPLDAGASTVLLEKTTPQALIDGIERHRATVLFTAPTAYRALAQQLAGKRLASLRKSVSAGEALPAATRALWKQASGLEMIDGIGSTEMLHIFISADEAHARPGATGLAVPGYSACVMDESMRPLPAGEVGRLAVKGPTGCRYLDDPRQRTYVQGGWNLTGDAYLMDADGYFIYQARTDDMIISAGYNIAGPEVEAALMEHPAVAECAVIGVSDEERGQIVKAFVVTRPGIEAGDALAVQLQEHVKRSIAPYKYPRAIEFRSELPRTDTGKLQRFRLREPAAGATRN